MIIIILKDISCSTFKTAHYQKLPLVKLYWSDQVANVKIPVEDREAKNGG